MDSPHAPTPGVMPVDRELWARQLHLSNFVNSYYQYRDLQSLPRSRQCSLSARGRDWTPECSSGATTGHDFDIDEVLVPDRVGACTRCPCSWMGSSTR